MQKRIALVTSGLGTRYGGIGVVAQAIKSALASEYSVLVWQHPPFWPRAARIARVSLRSFLGSLSKPELIIYDHVHLAVLHSSIPGLRHTPYAVFLHGIEVWEPLSGRRREALLGANLLIVNSATTVDIALRYNRWLPKAEIVWLGTGARHHRTKPRPQPIALIVGRMCSPERYKGHDAVLNAWPLLRKVVPDARLSIIGTGNDEARLKHRVKAEGLVGIEFRGPLSDSDRDAAYRSSRMLFYPSMQEGFGLATIEALSFGLPVVGLAGSVNEELFPNREGVILAKDATPESITEAATPLLQDSQFAFQLGELGRSRVERLFLEEHFAERFRHVLAPLLKAESEFDRTLIPAD